MSGALREILASFGIEVDGKALEKGHAQVESFIGKLQEFGKVAISAFAIDKVKGWTFSVAEQAEQLKLQAEKLGISTDALQKWEYAANLSGVSIETMDMGLLRLQRSAVAAGKGGSLAFGNVKVAVDKAGGGFKDADELLTDVAEAISNMKDPTQQVGAAVKAFGRNGAQLLPFLKQGKAGIAALKDEVEKLGGGFDEAFIEKSSEMIKDSKRLDFAMRGLQVSAIGPLLPLITDVVEWSTKAVVQFAHWVKGTNAIQSAIAVFGSVALIKTITGVAQLATKLGFLKNGISGLLLEMAPLIFGFLALEDVWTFFTGGRSVTGGLIEKFFGKDAPAKVRAFFDALKDKALADFGQAAKDVFTIFTDGEPLDVKFKELLNYVEGTLRPTLHKDFGAVGDDISLWLELLTGVLGVITEIAKSMKWVYDHSIKAVGGAIFSVQDAAANADAKRDAQKRPGGGGESWFNKLRDFLTPDSVSIDDKVARAKAAGAGGAPADRTAEQLAADQALDEAAAQRAYAPISSEGSAAPLTQNFTANVTQHIDAKTPEEVSKGASDGVKGAMADVGSNDRSMRALVPLAG